MKRILLTIMALSTLVTAAQATPTRTITMDTFAAYQKSDEEALLRMIDDQDKQAVEEMVLSGKAIMLAKGTPVYMVNAAFLGDLDEVRIKGSSRPVWIMRECVTTPEGKVVTPEAAGPGDQF